MSGQIMGRLAKIRELHAQFEKHLLKKLKEAEKLSGDPLGGVCNLIVDIGAVNVAKMLVDPHEVRSPPNGFIRLMENELARYTIEQAIIDFGHTGLFAEVEVETARARLAIYSKRMNRRRGSSE